MVGLIALVVDVGLFNLLMFAGSGVLDDKPLTAKAIAVVAATAVSYGLEPQLDLLAPRRPREPLAGVRAVLRPQRHRDADHAVRAVVLALRLGLDSVLADNISANVIGLGLGTVFRFWSYRKWVFPAEDRN